MFHKHQLLSEILENEHLMGSFLYSRGIDYKGYQDAELNEVCQNHRLDVDTILHDMTKWLDLKYQPEIGAISNLPIDLLIGYLRDTHQKFLWQRLPFMLNVVESLQSDSKKNEELVHDLKIVFPYFIDDFIHHIHEEEDTLFNYLLDLNAVVHFGQNPGKVFQRSKSICLHELAMHHHEDDDEMEGIRNLTNNYTIPDEADLNLKIIFAELKSFESELQRHAEIENNILFPKAISLHKAYQNKLTKTRPLN